MKVSLAFYFIQVFSLLTKQLIWCEDIFIDNASNNENANENNSKSLYPTSAHNYNSPNNSLSPTPITTELINPPPTLLYPEKLPKYIEQRDDINKEKSSEKNKKNRKDKNGKIKNENKTKNNKKKNRNDKKKREEKQLKKKESNKIHGNIIGAKFIKKRVKQNKRKYLNGQSKENNSDKPIVTIRTRNPLN